MSQAIQVFPRSFHAGDTPIVSAILYTDEETLEGAEAVASLHRLDLDETVAEGLEAETAVISEDSLRLDCRLSVETTAELAPGVYFLQFRVSFDDGHVLTVPPDDRLRVRVR